MNELIRIEKFLLSGKDKEQIEKDMIRDHRLRQNVRSVSKLLRIVKFYGRKKVKLEIQAVSVQIFKENRTFSSQINKMFNNQ